MYAKCGSLRAAEYVLHDILYQDSAPWNSLIVGYSRWGYDEEAVNCFKQMQCCCIPPNAITFASSLKACSVIGALEKGKQLQAEIVEEGSFDQDFVVGNALVNMYAKCGCLARAHEVLEKLPWPDEYSWTALITGYIKHGDYEEALNCYDQMQSNGVLPNAVTLSCVLKACGCIGIPRRGKQIHDQISIREFLEGDIIIGNSLVDMYAKCGLLAKAQEMFDKLPTQDTVSWTVMITGYSKQDHNKEALSCFQQMQIEGFPPDAMTFVCILRACSQIGALVNGRGVHEEASRRGFVDGDVNVGNALIDLYAKCGALDKAQEVFDGLTARDVASWNALIAGYVHAKENPYVFFLFDQMKRANEKPNIITFISILTGCCHSGLVEKGHLARAFDVTNLESAGCLPLITMPKTPPRVWITVAGQTMCSAPCIIKFSHKQVSLSGQEYTFTLETAIADVEVAVIGALEKQYGEILSFEGCHGYKKIQPTACPEAD